MLRGAEQDSYAKLQSAAVKVRSKAEEKVKTGEKAAN
jgi:hypothetical protein